MKTLIFLFGALLGFAAAWVSKPTPIEATPGYLTTASFPGTNPKMEITFAAKGDDWLLEKVCGMSYFHASDRRVAKEAQCPK